MVVICVFVTTYNMISVCNKIKVNIETIFWNQFIFLQGNSHIKFQVFK